MTAAFWHSFFVHFTVGLMGGAAIFYAVSLAFDQSAFAQKLIVSATACLWLCLSFTALTLLFGLMSFQHDPGSDYAVSAMSDHRHWAYFALFMLGICSMWSVQERTKPSIPFVATVSFTFLMLCATMVKGDRLSNILLLNNS